MKKLIPPLLCMLSMSQCLSAQAAGTDPTVQAESAKVPHELATSVPAATSPSIERRVGEPPAIALPDAFEFVSVADANAYDFVKACTPDATLNSFNKLVADVGDKMTASTRPTDKSKPYLVVTRGKAYCIRMSEMKYAIIPPSAFDKTIFFPGMDKEERNAMHADLARQLAARGTATATVVGEQGYVFVLTYLYASARPIKMYYHATFMKYDGTREGYVGNVYKTPGPFSEFTYEQGGDQENVKYFFSK